ncbi:MAG TPA: hypothetical protein VGU74_09530 [Gemmatimonadales bacterium]|nr:hypothetical protein [Gemmatimonadales bacterium]
MIRIRQSERGVALLMALSAIVLIGVVVAGILFAVTQDYRVSDNNLRQARATAAAELGLGRIRTEWNLADNNRVTGDTIVRSYTAPGGATCGVIVTRLPGPYFWVVSEGRSGDATSRNSARRRFGMLMRLDTPDIPFIGALTGRGNILVGGSATVNGKDAAPTGWPNCVKQADIPGIAMSDTTAGLKLPGCSVGKSCVDGNPKFLQTLAAADTATYFVYGNSTYQDLAATAGVVVPGGQTLNGMGPSVVAGACATSVLTNWGDPNRAIIPGACESYMPIIHALGDLHISGGSGQGILLVDGDLELTGGFTFVGVIIVRGTLRSTGTGAHVTGGVMAANVDLDADNTVLGNSSIQYSSCAISAVMSGSAYPKQAKQRGWVDLY